MSRKIAEASETIEIPPTDRHGWRLVKALFRAVAVRHPFWWRKNPTKDSLN